MWNDVNDPYRFGERLMLLIFGGIVIVGGYAVLGLAWLLGVLPREQDHDQVVS